MMEDLLHDGNVDLAMQKAFRWGFEDQEGEKTPGLRDLMQRLRDDRQELLESAGPADAGEETGLQESDAPDDPAADNGHLVSQMEAMERSLRAIESLDDLQGLDPDMMDTVLTNQERSWIDQWANMKGTLTGVGLTIEVGDHLELTPRAVRRIGEHALRAIFSSVTEGTGGDHEMRRRGRTGTQVETSVPWQFGDPFTLNMSRTIMNSVVREGPGGSVRLLPDDFEVFERESRGSTATVLLIDMSRSMFYNGCWDAAKRAALALDTLMRGQFQRDELEIAGFSERAERLTLSQLPSLEWNEYSHGTNLEDGLRLARELLRPHRGKTRQIVLITDGEPTAFMDEGEVRFEHPPTEKVFEATLREAMRCTRERILINTFLLEQSAMMVGFAERMSRVNRGRLIHVDPANLGRYLLRDFLQNRTAQLH
jgi:uncharacterized protein with von Willebrand factor type A (vWA) domain